MPCIETGLLISGGSDKVIYVFDPIQTENVVYRLEGHTENICTLSVTPNGSILSGSWDRHVVLKGFESLLLNIELLNYGKTGNVSLHCLDIKRPCGVCWL